MDADSVKVMGVALRRAFTMDEVETVRTPSRLTRLFTYASAVWIATVDGAVTPEETRALTLLGDRLGLSQVARDRARGVALGLGAARHQSTGWLRPSWH
ncbi:MAG: hypothetical protein U0263_21990 [Polyangiaceae bacterium]